MSKRKRRARQQVSREEPPPAPARATGRPARFAVIVVTAAAAVLLLKWGTTHRGDGGAGTLPPPLPAARGAEVSYADFVGAETCGQCHRVQYAAWQRSTHGRAGGPPSRDRVIAPFDGRPIRFRDATVTPSVNDRREYLFTVARDGRPAHVIPVVAVVGGGHLVGGGTQGYFAANADGTLRFLPFDYSATNRVWFCNTGGRTNRGWVPITSAISLDECGDWPPVRVLGSHERFQNCEQCHGSQIRLTLDPAAKRYVTRFTTLDVNCESCHGPGRRHVELARSGGADSARDLGLTALATLTKDQSLGVCFQCHALKQEIRPGYLPGDSLLDYFALGLLLHGDPLFPDGRVREFAYQEGHRYSDCYLNGSMRCTDCHEPHGQGYRDVNGAPLAGRFSNGQCTGCHASKADPAGGHTHHRANSPGSRCVSCHMPYVQEPLLGNAVRYARSDHTVAIPRPGFDSQLGILNACATCHMDRPATTLERQVAEWYRTLKPHHSAITGLLRGDSARDRPAAAELLLGGERHPAAQAAGVARFLKRYLTPNMRELEPEIVRRLERLAASRDADVQALALASLHLARGTDGAVRGFLAERLRDLGERDAPIRDRWVWVLNSVGDGYMARRDFRAAAIVYRRAQEVEPEEPTILRNLGLAASAGGDHRAAIQYLRDGLARDSTRTDILVNLAFALQQRGDFDAAIATYVQAISVNPYEPFTYLSLGNAYQRRGQVERAIPAYERAIELDPRLGAARRALEQLRGGTGGRPR